MENIRAGARKTSEKMTQERRDELSKRFKSARTGRAPANKGQRGLQVAWNKGIPATEKQKERLRAMRCGQTMSMEARAKISATLKGRMPVVNQRRLAMKAAIKDAA